MVPTLPKKRQRTSKRFKVTPKKADGVNTINATTFSGKPLDGKKEWTKSAIINFLANIDNKKVLLGENTSKQSLVKKIINSKSAPDYMCLPSAVF